MTESKPALVPSSRLRRIGKFSHRWSGAIAVCGGLVLFFSWVVSNTFKDQSVSIQSKIDAARKEHELFSETAEIRQDLRRINYRVTTLQDHLLTKMPEMERALIPIRQTFDLCDDFFFHIFDQDRAAAMQRRLIHAHPGDSKVGSQVEDLFNEYRGLSKTLIEARKRATFYVHATGTPNEMFLKAARDAIEEYRKLCDTNRARSEVAAEELQTATNIIQDELRTEMANAKWRANCSSKALFALYVLGSVLVLYGAMFEKGFPKHMPVVSPPTIPN